MGNAFRAIFGPVLCPTRSLDEVGIVSGCVLRDTSTTEGSTKKQRRRSFPRGARQSDSKPEAPEEAPRQTESPVRKACAQGEWQASGERFGGEQRFLPSPSSSGPIPKNDIRGRSMRMLPTPTPWYTLNRGTTTQRSKRHILAPRQCCHLHWDFREGQMQANKETTTLKEV